MELFSFFYFNPRTCEGCDEAEKKGEETKANISIHAPVKGATNESVWDDINRMNFNPRTREGCDGLQIGSVTICSLINHIAN